MIRMSRREFVRLVRQAYKDVPPKVKLALTNVDISVEELPGPEVFGSGGLAGTGGLTGASGSSGMEEGDRESGDGNASLFGLYVGVPLPERHGGEPELPDRIVIYRQPILQNCKNLAEAKKEIRITLLHEVGHYLGMDEDDLHRLGYG